MVEIGKDITGALLRNAIGLRRFENRVASQMAGLVERAYQRIIGILASQDPTDVSTGRVPARLASINGKIDDVLTQLYKDLAGTLKGELVSVGQVQEAFASGQLENLAPDVPVTAPELGRSFWTSVVATDPIQGAPLANWWGKQKADTAFAFRREVQLGMTQNETIDQLVRRVRGESIGNGRFAGGVMETTTKQATTLVRTAVNHVATEAHFQTFSANTDITEEYQFVATLDSRTSPICRALDGQVFRYDDDGAPRPPMHPNCRSTIVPVIDWKALGLKAPKPGKRAAEDGPVSSDTTYTDWLREQTQAEQDDILGPARAKLFRSNKVSLKDLVASDGTQYTLDDLKEFIS